MLITKISPFTGKPNTMNLNIDPEKYAAWARGEGPHIQDAFPHLTPDEREFLISGTTPEEWDKYMTPPEEEE